MRANARGRVALLGVVAVSGVLHALAAWRVHGPWILPDEAIYGTRAFELWRHGPLALIRLGGVGSEVLYPVFAGPFLAHVSANAGYGALKMVQAFVISLAAVPVFCYGRRLMPERYAAVAAVLTVCSPLLLYSSFLMTEVLFYPLGAAALLAVARAVASGSRRTQAVAWVLIVAAVLTRVQGVVFVPVFAAAVVVDCALRRDWRRAVRFWPVGAVAVAGLAVLLAFPGTVGVYSSTLRTHYSVVTALRMTYDHLAYVTLVTGAAPVAALLALLVGATRREVEPALRALAAVAASALILLPLQVGVFAAGYSPTLLGRNLAPLPPLLFVVLTAWLAHERRREHRVWAVTIAAAFAVLAVIALAPWNDLVTSAAFVDSPDLVVFTRLQPLHPADIATLFALALLTAFALLGGRRFAVLIPAAIAAVLVFASVPAAHDLAGTANASEAALAGPTPSWIDEAARGRPVTYVYDGGTTWTDVWLERFWNHDVRHVVTLGPKLVPGPLRQTRVDVLPPSGRLPTDDRLLVAPDNLTLRGEPVAHLAQQGIDVSGLTLWRLDGPARLSTAADGVQPNGDMTRRATVTVYDCARGSLELTLLPKATSRLRVLLDGGVVREQELAGRPSWGLAIPVPPGHRSPVCGFTIVPHLLLGSTRIAFDRG